ncbi:MAG: DNA-binding Lrp family transcriptional regulator [Acidimicrobiales bacterium]|jgi:DNA-binding Lrp family transcriptional regulator
MSADPLTILFGSQARVKLLRFFLFNPSKEFTFEDISKRARLVRRTARTEITALEKAGVIKKKQIYVPKEEGSEAKVRVQGYALDKSLPELQALQTFLFETAPIDGKTVLKHLRKAGTLDFVCVAGIFLRDFEHRLDILLSMKKLSQAKVENAIRALEAELGIEVRFASFTSEDLIYRVGMYDKLVRDMFDYPHEIIVDKIAIKDELHRP